MQQLSFTQRVTQLTQYSAKQQGSSLIEVLVALLVLAVGLLGMASLLNSSLRINQEAYFMTQVPVNSYDII